MDFNGLVELERQARYHRAESADIVECTQTVATRLVEPFHTSHEAREYAETFEDRPGVMYDVFGREISPQAVRDAADWYDFFETLILESGF